MDELKILEKHQLYEIYMKERRKIFGDQVPSHKGKGELIHDILVLRACKELSDSLPKLVFPRGKVARPPGVEEVKTEDCVVRVPHLKTKNSIRVEDVRQEKHIHSVSKSVLRTSQGRDIGEGKRIETVD